MNHLLRIAAIGLARRALWIVACFAVLVLLAYQGAYRSFGIGLPHSTPEFTHLMPLPLSAASSFVPVTRNPFDAAQTPWTGPPPPQNTDETRPGASDLLGVIQLPGVVAAVTDRGLTYAGQNLGGGKLKGIRGDSVVIETATGESAQSFGRPPRPTLESLNRTSQGRRSKP